MSQIPQSFLFRLRFPCRRYSGAQRALTPETLDATYSVPYWIQCSASNGFDRKTAPGASRLRDRENSSKFDLRVAWLPSGFFITTVVSGKSRQPCWTHTELRDADVLRVCLDTRDVKDVHRGTRFCHKFAFYPIVGESDDVAGPLAQWSPINRAKASPNAIDVADFQLASERRADGYALSIFMPSSTLTGFGPEEFNRLGFHFFARDSEYGAFALQLGEPFPVDDDPSLWGTLILV